MLKNQNLKRRKNRKALTAFVFSLLLFFGAHSVQAVQPGANPVAAKKPAPPKGGEGKKQVLRFDALTITGEAAQPQVYYLLNRRQILFKHEPVKKDLVEQIRKTVEDEPF